MMYPLYVRDPTVAGGRRAFTVNEMARKMALAARPASSSSESHINMQRMLKGRICMYINILFSN